jgi:hypothetical protein
LVALSTEKDEVAARLQEAERERDLALTARGELQVAIDAARGDMEAVRATLVERTSALASLTGCVRPVLEESASSGRGRAAWC